MHALNKMVFVAHSSAASDSGFVQGVMHPLQGPDHLVAMVGVGVLSAALADRSSLWRLPLIFLTGLLAGGILGYEGFGITEVEALIAVSLVSMGLLILSAGANLAQLAALPAVALFGLVHGNAHGLELPAAAAPVLYSAGFLVSSATCHIAGIGIGTLSARWKARPLGWPVLLFGCALLGQAVTA